MKSVRDMTDEEFTIFVGMKREVARSMMMHVRHSPIPDRPMHPDAKMSGGDKPCWDADMDMWLNMVDPGITNPHYIDSTMCDKCKGEIDGLEQSQSNQASKP
jgi:hypothetical protein